MRTALSRLLALGLLLALICVSASAADIESERTRMKLVLDTVSSEIQKHYYDPAMKGIDWKAKTDEARAKIDKADSVTRMLMAIFVLTDSLKDSHTMFVPPGRLFPPSFGYDALVVGDKVFVTEVKKAGAADKAGLQLGDELLSVNSYDADRQTFSQMMLFFRALRPVDTLELEVQRGSEVKKFTIAAEGPVQQQILDVTKFDTFWQLLRETQSDQEDPYRWSISSDGIGYLELPSFALSEETLNSMVAKMKSAKALIVDLRSNPGGRFESLRKLAGHFDPRENKLADVVGRKGPVPMKIIPLRPQLTAPLFVLIDSRSASAAELFAYHIRLTKRGVVIGDQSAGRLMDARILYEQAGSDALILYGIEVSTGKVVFPGGTDFEGKGVQPDIMCLPSAQEIAAKHDTCRDLTFAKARKALAAPKPRASTKRKKHRRAN